MELQIILSILFSFVALFYLYTKFKKSSIENLPPQPWKLPFIGHLHHLHGALPHRAFGRLADKIGPVIHLQLGEVSTVVISSPVFAKEVMKTHDLTFANRSKLLAAEVIAYDYKDIIFAPYGEYWRQMRKICILELSSAKKVRSFESIRDEESWNLIESIKGSNMVDLTKMIDTMMNVIAVKVAVGSKCRDQDDLLALIKDIASLSSGFDVSDLFPSVKVLPLVTGSMKKMTMIRNKIDKLLDSIISDHQERRTDGLSDHNEDLLEVLLRLKDDGGLRFPLTSDHIKAILVDIFAAGTDTAAVTIEWAMLELMKNPNIMEKVQAELRLVLKGKNKIYESDIQELEYFKLVIKETLRLHPPLPLLVPRECKVKCEIGVYQIPANTKVIINVWKIGRDPDYWVDPESFIPERFNESSVNMMGTDFEFLPFGAGRRMCPGMNLGLANIELPLARLLYHFNWGLPNGVSSEDLDMSETLAATLNLKHHLHLVPSAYNTN
ncbi:germacrene A hydroxylase-like [Rutidosis leptorrhynchoides]|uniref:germacrene A hydroxylase-like n=1 Tax=Rutidosis leptorrhynchoides TaxID=125765 RepID=UPI003A994C37